MRDRERFDGTVRLIVLLLAVTLGCGTPAPEPGATTEVLDREIPGDHSSQDLNPLTAQQWIDEVRLGTSVDDQGGVGQDAMQDQFSPERAIYVSMRVADAPAGSVVRVAVYDDAEHEVWMEERAIASEQPYLTFKIEEGALDVGHYEAHVHVGDEQVSVRELEVRNDVA
jgi:hypothetical protein